MSSGFYLLARAVGYLEPSNWRTSTAQIAPVMDVDIHDEPGLRWSERVIELPKLIRPSRKPVNPNEGGVFIPAFRHSSRKPERGRRTHSKSLAFTN